MADEVRQDPVLGTRVHIVRHRKDRPNLPSVGCPFCVGGLEAPQPYEVHHFPNRWPAMDGDRCEVVLYTPDHDATFWSLGQAGARKVVDLWAARTAELGARDDVDAVLVFENRGADVGATISHPHGQIYAYDHVPERQMRRLAWRPDRVAADSGERLIVARNGWAAWVPYAPVFPISIELAPLAHLTDLVSMGDADRDAFAALLVDVLGRLDRMWSRPLPYMLWLNQRPFTKTSDGAGESAWFNVEIVSPWRQPGVMRFIAAAEIAGVEYFNEVVPEDLAARLRGL
jgi:UDPglucose--hexose-1-phosphate uridylyltransferase